MGEPSLDIDVSRVVFLEGSHALAQRKTQSDFGGLLTDASRVSLLANYMKVNCIVVSLLAFCGLQCDVPNARQVFDTDRAMWLASGVTQYYRT